MKYRTSIIGSRIIFMIALTCITRAYLIATPYISNVTTPESPISLYDIFEISYSMPAYISPYNPDIINSYCEFWSPSNKYYKIYAFYYEGFTKTSSNCQPISLDFQCETLTANGNNSWKIRFTPNETGTWRYKISANDQTGRTSLQVLYFSCVNSDKKGFIVKANKKFLKRTSGEFFFPIGQNIPWYHSIDNYSQTYGTNEYIYYIDKMAENGANFIRVWLDAYSSMALIGYDYTTQTSYYNLYNQKDAFQLDYILNYAQANGINILLCLFSHASWGDSAYCNNTWTNRNPFNSRNGGCISNPYSFFSDTNAINITKNLLRYIISRWGYATNLMAWELWNEVNQIEMFNPAISVPSSYQEDVINWHNIMYHHIKSIDPFQHLITTSFSTYKVWENKEIFSTMDFSQSHDYKDICSLSLTNNFQSHMYSVAKRAIDSIGKPYFSGEWGLFSSTEWQQHDPKGFILHSTLWSSSFSTALGSPANWWWNNYIKPKNLFDKYKSIALFMNSLPIPSESFVSNKILEINGLNTYYMSNTNSDTIYGWTQDSNFDYVAIQSSADSLYLKTLDPSDRPGPSSLNNEIAINVKNDGRQYIINWINAETGLTYTIETAVSNNNKLKIFIPQLLRNSTYGDAAFKIYLDCDVYIWREEELANNTYNNVSGNIVCNNGQVFYKSFNNRIHSLWWSSTNQAWLWSSLNNAATNVAGDLAISPNGNQIFYRTTANAINSIFGDSETQAWLWTDLNQVANVNVKGPIVVSNNNQVFYRTNNNELNNIWWNSSLNKWIKSTLNSATVGNVGDALAVSSNNQVFYTTSSNSLENIWWDSSTQRWQRSTLNNAAHENVYGNISISSNNQVFFKTQDNKLNNIWWNSSLSRWYRSSLDNAADNVAGDILACDGHVLYRNTNSNINGIYWDNGVWNWTSLNDATSNNVLSGNLATNDLGNIFFISSDRTIHRLFYKSQCDYSSSQNCLNKYAFLGTYLIDDNNNTTTKDNDDFQFPEFNIFPNPTNNTITIATTNDYITSIFIFNTDGMVIKTINLLYSDKIEIDVSSLDNGLYFTKIYLLGGDCLIGNFIIKH